MSEEQQVFLPEGIEDEAVLSVFKDPKVQEALKRTLDKREAPLKNKRDELLGNHKALSDQIKEIGGLDAAREAVSKIQKLEAEHREAQQKALMASGDVEKISKAYQTQLAEKDNELTTFKQTLVKKELSSRVSDAIRKADGVPELLSDRLGARVQGRLGDDGSIELTVLNANGSPMLLSDGKSASLTDLVNEFRNDPVFGVAFKVNPKSGTGGKTATGGAKTAGNPFDRSSPSRNVTEQMKLKKADPIRARQLAQEAGLDVSRW